jgi:hypothetical protein
MNKEDTKQAILGFTEFFKGITGNQDLKMPDDIAKKYEIEPNKWIPAEVLDKIRAEIEAKCCITVGRENDGAITLHDVFEIIDKYRESEG